MKPIYFIADTLEKIQRLPPRSRRAIGYQLHLLQLGEKPYVFRHISAAGRGFYQLLTSNGRSEHRVIHVVKIEDRIYVLHIFSKGIKQSRTGELYFSRQRFTELKDELSREMSSNQGTYVYSSDNKAK